MGDWPCPFGMHEFTGKAESIYVRLGQGVRMKRKALKLCSEHFLDVMEKVTDKAELVMEGEKRLIFEEPALEACHGCGQVNPPSKAFLDVYGRGAPPRKYFAALCEECEAGWAQDLRITA